MRQFDLVRIDAVQNGYVVTARLRGRKPQAYAYTDRWVAANWDEVMALLAALDVKL